MNVQQFIDDEEELDHTDITDAEMNGQLGGGFLSKFTRRTTQVTPDDSKSLKYTARFNDFLLSDI